MVIDERVIEKFNIEEISIGDYILSSGDLAAYILIDACLRNIPKILHCQDSLQEESFGNSPEYRNLLEYEMNVLGTHSTIDRNALSM